MNSMKKNITLYTFQKLFVWENLCELGYYHPFFLDEVDTWLTQERKDGQWGFLPSYTWLKNKMNEKGITYENNNSHLIWAWYQWNGLRKKAPDKRYSSVYDYFDTPYVMMELSIPRERVLLSDYDAWHFVLNYWYLEKAHKSNCFKKAYNFYRIKPNDTHMIHPVIDKSWENIFDMKASREILQYPQKHQKIQATFFELFYTDVKKVHFFSNKRCTSMIELPH